jgi:signal transduction histidine kinase
MGLIADRPLKPPPARIDPPRKLRVAPPKRRNLSIVARILVASVLLALVVTAAFAVLVIALSNLRTTTSEANRSKDVTAATLLLQQYLVAADASLRGYLNTNDLRFLRTWNDVHKSLTSSATAVEERAAYNTGQERRAKRLTEAINTYVSDYVIPLVGVARINPAVARSPIALTEGRHYTEPIQKQIATMLRVENGLAAERVASARSQASRAIVIGLAALGSSVVLVLLFGAELARGIARPIRRTSEAAKDVAGGDLGVRVPETGPLEVHELATSFNQMAVSLEEGKHELEGQNEQLRESERQRFELVSAVSHEVRTPLACVLGYTSLLLTRDISEDERRRYLQIIGEEARRLEALVDDLVDAKRIEEGRLVLEEELFDLGAVVSEQVESFAGRSPSHVVHMDVFGEKGDLKVLADRGRVAQVIANLLSNAIKYSPHGGSIDVSASRQDGLARVGVRDEGPGIPSEYRSRIFSKFFRGEAAHSGVGGVGLGLAISREIVEAHGGRMGFESEPGSGSLFWFELPAAGE